MTTTALMHGIADCMWVFKLGEKQCYGGIMAAAHNAYG
jgi:hypothetical protein